MSIKKNLSQAFNGLIYQLCKKEYIRNGRVFSSTLRARDFRYLLKSLKEFTKSLSQKDFEDYTFEDITEDFLDRYVKYLRRHTVRSGSGGNIESQIAKFKQVFGYANVSTCIFYRIHVAPKKDKSKVKNYPSNAIKMIESIDRAQFSSKEQFCIDLFIFSCYTGGPTLREMAYLTTDLIQDQIFIRHERFNTGKIALTPLIDKAQAIIERYKDKCCDNFLLPIFTHKHKTEIQQIGRTKRIVKVANLALKKVSQLLNFDSEVTMSTTKQLYIEALINGGYDFANIATFVGCNIELVLKYMMENPARNYMLDE